MIRLDPVTLDHCTEKYLSWLNDPEVNRYLETRFCQQSLETISEFVKSRQMDESCLFRAIIDIETNQHIGNAKVMITNSQYMRGEISYFIGERSYWGRGFATRVVKDMTIAGIDALGLRKIRALVRCTNVASQRVVLKCGYTLEYVLKNEERLNRDSPWEDVYCYVYSVE